MIAIEVSSADRKAPYGSIGGAIRNTVHALLRIDPETRYDLCHRLSRARKGNLFRPDAPNVRTRITFDPFNAILMPGNRIFHSMGVHAPRTPRIPKLVTIHDLNAVRNKSWVRPEWHETRTAKIRGAVERADHIVTYSAFIADEIAEEFGFDRSRIHPVLLGVDDTTFHPADAATRSKLRARHGDYAIAIGQLTPRKNFTRLVEAMARLPELRLVLVGGGAEAETEVEQAIDRHGIRDRVTRLAGLPTEELVALIGAARLCVVPSLYEGFGLPPLEAMACGTPVVCSTAASLPEAAGDAVHPVDATRVDALVAGMRRVLEDTDYAADLRDRGHARVERFSWETTARQLRGVYREVAGV